MGLRDAFGGGPVGFSRVRALPFLSALAPSERYAARRGRRHKKITEWAWQMLLVLRRWHPRPEIVVVADRAYASLKLLDRCSRLRDPIIFVTRLRLDAALYEPAFQEEARTHLGFETQRQWSEMAIRRTTPALLGLFSLVTVFAHRRMAQAAGVFRQAACYRKRHPTFADALAMVRKELRAQEPWTFCGSPSATDTTKVPRAYVERLTEAVCYAA